MRADALLTDLYELTMMEGYYRNGLIAETAVFDVFFRGNPFGGGYAVFAGLEQAASYLTGLSFSPDDYRLSRHAGDILPRLPRTSRRAPVYRQHARVR